MCSTKNSTKVIALQSGCYLAEFLIFLNKCLSGLEEDEINVSFSIDTESLTVCFIVHWQENLKMKMLNFTLGTVFIFNISATSRSRCSLLFCIKVVLRLDVFRSKYTGNSPTGTPRRIHVDSTWILRRYVQDQILTNFHVIFAYFFDVISLVEKSTWFPRTFFDVISMVEKSTLFPRTFFDVISMVEKSTLFHVLLSV